MLKGRIDNLIIKGLIELKDKKDKGYLRVDGDDIISVLPDTEVNSESDNIITNKGVANSINNLENKINTDIQQLRDNDNQLNLRIDSLNNSVNTNTQAINSLSSRVDTNTNDITTIKANYITKNVNDLLNYYLKNETYNKSEVNNLIKDFITKSVNDLINYYTKNETYTKQQVNDLISSISASSFLVVDRLPTNPLSNIIYLVPAESPEQDNYYNEYVYINGQWEMIGSTKVDLSNYYNKTQIDEKFNNVNANITTLSDGLQETDNRVTENTNDIDALENSTVKQTDLESMKYSYVKDGVVNNNIALTDEEKLKVETWLGLSENYLTYYNETPYQVNGDYNPANKKYVDDEARKLDDKIKEIQLFKFPNAVIIGEPTINNGQVSGFSVDNYLVFPFILDVGDRNFQIDFSFTTGNDVTTQQNILDSKFGIALAIANGKGLMAISSNGTSWSGTSIGTINIAPNTTYYARLTWNKLVYKTALSTDGVSYTDDMSIVLAQRPYPRTIYIGSGSAEELGRTPNVFKGIINMNKASLSVGGAIIWQGMDDVGLATRADVSLSNLDELGEQRFTNLQANINTKASQSDLTTHTSNGTIHVTASDKIAWSQKQDAIGDLSTIRSNASAGKSASDTISGYGNIVTHNASEFAKTTDLTSGTLVVNKATNDGNGNNIVNTYATKNDLSGINNQLEDLNGVPASTNLLNYPIGAVYLSMNNTSPASLFGGSWEQLAENYALWTASSGAGSTINAGLPNITGGGTPENLIESIGAWTGGITRKGAIGVDALHPIRSYEPTGVGSYGSFAPMSFDASQGEVHNGEYSNLVYGKSDTVQPPAIKVYAWKRVS